MVGFAEVAAGAKAAGALMSGVGAIRSDRGLPYESQLAEQRRHTKHLDVNRPTWIVRGAKNAGIHPLAALGIAPTTSAATTIGSGPGDAYHAGKAIAKAAESWLQKDIDKEALKQARLRTAMMQNEVEGMHNAHVIQNANSQQDGYETNFLGNSDIPMAVPDGNSPIDLINTQVPRGQHKVVAAGPGGRVLNTAFGLLPFKASEMSGQQSEDLLGEGVGTIQNFTAFAKAKNRYNNALMAARRVLPGHPDKEYRVPGAPFPIYKKQSKRKRAYIEKKRQELVNYWMREFARTGEMKWQNIKIRKIRR